MKLRVSTDLFNRLSRARAWSGCSFAEIARKAYCKFCRRAVVLTQFQDSTTYKGTVIQVPDTLSPDATRSLLVWYLSQYDIPEAPEGFTTDQREGVDYIVEGVE